MNYNFARIGAFTPEIKVADTLFNTQKIIDGAIEASRRGVEVLCFPELSLTGCSCGDLFYQDILLSNALEGLYKIAKNTKDLNILLVVGLPFKKDGQVYNVAAVVNGGKILGIVPKSVIVPTNDNQDGRYFAPAPQTLSEVSFVFGGEHMSVPFGTNIIFSSNSNACLRIAVEFGDDLYASTSPSVAHSLNGANLILCLAGDLEIVGKKEYRIQTVLSHSSKIAVGYVMAQAGALESTTDGVFSGHNIIAENGKMIIQSKLFSQGLTFTELDLGALDFQRGKGLHIKSTNDYLTVCFDVQSQDESLTRSFEKTPFLPLDNEEKEYRAELILNLQAEGLKKRIQHANAKCAVLGISGGLDSTLALIVAVKAMKKLNRSPKDVVAVTMPCFGTTDRTYQNAVKLTKALGATLKKVDIAKSVTRHLKDINHQDGVYDVTYENAQARERTQVIMDIANMFGGLVVGTGDLSELALGWATYNGDHMSMYGVNAGVPKTLVRHLVGHFANQSKGKLKSILLDVLDTPVSPELLPVENGKQNQQTEDIVGPYVLHDFYLYYFVRKGYSPNKLFYLASKTFKGDFSEQTIKKWLKIFFNRFFTQQFKRSCLPDGVKIGTVGFSPRGDWHMPSDAFNALWKEQAENL